MLSSDMVEKLQGVIHIEVAMGNVLSMDTRYMCSHQDACMEVVQQMVRYLYTAKVGRGGRAAAASVARWITTSPGPRSCWSWPTNTR
jgi:hypothetical protein